MDKIKLKFVGFLGLLVFCVFGEVLFGGRNVFANTSVVLTPMNQQILLVPGETYEGLIEVGNSIEADEDLNYAVTTAPYNMKEGGDGKNYDSFDFAEKTNANMIVDWITVKNSEGVLKPGESTKVQFQINVPKDAPAGGQYMALLVGGKKEVSQGDGEVAIKQTTNMAAKILAKVAGETVEKGEILENNVPGFLLNGVLETTSLVENRGNVHAEANYVLQVWPMGSEEEICTNEEAAGAILVLPETKQYHKESCLLSSPGIYKAKQTVKIFGEESIKEATIIYCPIWLMLVILFGIAMIVLWLVMMARGRKKTARREAKAEEKAESAEKEE